MTKKTLSEKRAADRSFMADAIEKLVTECGATFERLAPDCVGPHEIFIEVTAPGGLRVTVDFDGKSDTPNVHWLAWHMHYDSNKRLNNATFGGDVNANHKRKATYICQGFDDLCKQLRSGLMLAKDGTAYLPEEEAVAA